MASNGLMFPFKSETKLIVFEKDKRVFFVLYSLKFLD